MAIPDGAIPIDQFEQASTVQPQGHGASGAIPIDQFKSADDEYGGAGQMALTGIEGVAHGFAGPLATGVEKGLSAIGVPGLTPHDQEMRADTNPVSANVGEIGGFTTGLATGTGEAALLARLGEGAVGAAKLGEAASVGGKILSGAVRAGAEVAGYQAGNETSKVINDPTQILTDPGKALGSAAINIGLAGILGGAGGAVLGAVPAGWRAFAGRSATEEGITKATDMASEAVPQASDDATQAVTNQPTGDTLTDSIQKPSEKESFLKGLQKQKENAAEIRAAGETIGVPVSSSQTSASDYVQSMDSALSQSPTVAGIQRQQEIQNGFDKIGGIIDQTVAPATDSTAFERGEMIKSQIQNKVDNIYTPLREGYAQRAALGETIALPDAARQKQFNSLVELSQKFEKASPETAQMIEDVGHGLNRQENVADLDEYMKVLSQKQRALRISGDHYGANAMGEAIEKVEDFQVRQIAKQGAELQAQGADHAKAIANDIVNQHKALKAKYADFKSILGDLAGDSKLGKGATTAGGLSSKLEDIPSEKLVDKMFDKKNSQGLARLQKNFPDVFETVINGKKGDLVEAAQGNHKALLKSIFDPKTGLSPEMRNLMFKPEELKMLDASKTWIDSLPKNVGPSGTPKGLAYMNAVGANVHPTITGMVDRLAGSILQNTRDFGIKSLLKFATPAEIETNKATADFIQHANKGANTLDKATKAFFKSGELIPQHLLPTKESRERLDKSLDAFKSPDTALNVGGSIGHYLPDHQTAAAMMAAQAANYLHTLKPDPQPATPFDFTPPVDKAAQAKYDRALDIAQQPLMILQHAKNGTLLPQDVQTIQAVNPSVHQMIVENMTHELIDQKAKENHITYHQKMSLATLLGSPVDSSMTPQSMQAVINSAGANMAQQSAGPQKQGHASQATLGQMNKVNAMYQTPTEVSQGSKRS